MNQLADTRAALHHAVAPILPGRTNMYPPQSQLVGAPYIWIGDHEGRPSTIGDRTKVTVATFQIFVVYDGADRAQVAGIDDVVAHIVDNIRACPLAVQVDGWRSEPADPATHRRLYRVDVAVTITATTMCPPSTSADVVFSTADVVFGRDDVVAGPDHSDLPPDPVPDPPRPEGPGQSPIPPSPIPESVS